MLRWKRFHCAGIAAGCSTGSACAAPLHQCSGRTFFGFGGKNSSGKDAANSQGSGEQNKAGGGGFPFSAPPGFDPAKMQEFFQQQPPEKQREILEKALEMQKMMGRVPGLGKMAQRNTEMVEQFLKASGNSPSSTGSDGKPVEPVEMPGFSINKKFKAGKNEQNAGGNKTTCNGPTLDELKKVDLGPEIEALFKELKTIRDSKNSYRDKLHTTEGKLTEAHKELETLRGTESSLRSKLRKVEQDVMLLTSENMELRESSNECKQLKKTNASLLQQVRKLETGDAVALRKENTKLAADLNEKTELLRSLHRKLERQRRRDPFLQFSLHYSDIIRLCDHASESSAEAPGSAGGNAAAPESVASPAALVKTDVDNAFYDLQSEYEKELSNTWQRVCSANGTAAKVIVASAEQFFRTRVPHANLDAVMQIVPVTDGRGKNQPVDVVDALAPIWKSVGVIMESLGDDKYLFYLPKDAKSPLDCGVFGRVFAWKLASDAAASQPAKEGKDSVLSQFRFASVRPCVSDALVKNPHRATVSYESTRSAGPGGQAANVTETQITAKLSIDGQYLFKAEAQDSRSATENKSAATEKLETSRRQQFNDTVGRQQSFTELRQQLLNAVQEKGGVDLEPSIPLVDAAVRDGTLPVASAVAFYGLVAGSKA